MNSRRFSCKSQNNMSEALKLTRRVAHLTTLLPFMMVKTHMIHRLPKTKRFQTSIVSRLFRFKVALINHRLASSDSDLCRFKPKARTFFCTTSQSDKSALITTSTGQQSHDSSSTHFASLRGIFPSEVSKREIRDEVNKFRKCRGRAIVNGSELIRIVRTFMNGC